MTRVEVVETPGLGDRSYVVSDGTVAFVVDPQRDIDRIIEVVRTLGVRLTHVFETHIHNDYVSGGLELARTAGAAYVLPADDDVAFEHLPAAEGDHFHVGALIVRALATPGHTPHHTSYVVADAHGDVAVFTGGSMLYGTVGRTDLISEEATGPLSRAQFRSVRRLADELAPGVAVHPTHGFGSFCSSSPPSGQATSTIGDERRVNIATTTDDEETFVKHLLGGLTAYPRYYAHMAPINRAGPPPVDLSPPDVVDPADLSARMARGERVVDVRPRQWFAAWHVAGSINVQLDDRFATYLGWTTPWGVPITLLADSDGDVADAQRHMVRIGIDRPAGAATGGPGVWGAIPASSYPTATWADVADVLGQVGVVVLDVRRPDEWEESHLAGAVHIPLHELERRVGELPAGAVYVHCGSGYRAAVAASLLERAGRAPVLVDAEWSDAADQPGLPLVRG